MERDILVVGLGNPGPRYALNRHNFGFMVADELANRSPSPASWHEKFSGRIARIGFGPFSFTLLKPETFMNLSGRSVARAVQFFGFAPRDIIVVHDEVDLEYTVIRVKDGGGTAGHKGIASIKDTLGDGGFIRVRMGVGRPQHGMVSDYVLGDFTRDERVALGDVIARGADAVQKIASDGVAVAMNDINRRV